MKKWRMRYFIFRVISLCFLENYRFIYVVLLFAKTSSTAFSQNEFQIITSIETRTLGFTQIPLQIKVGVPSISRYNFTLWHFLSVESNRSFSPAIGFGTGCMGRGFQIPSSLFLLGEFQLRYVTPRFKEVYPSLTHLSKFGLGYRFKQPISLTLMMSFDNQWSFFTEFGLVYPIIYKPKPSLRSQLRCPRF
jgi:hypothetical protein